MAGRTKGPRRNFRAARRRAREAANGAVGDELDHVVAGADELERVLADLKLHDDATYRHLTRIVRDATNRNESIGSLIARLRAVGGAGFRLAESVEGLTPAGLLGRLGEGGTRE